MSDREEQQADMSKHGGWALPVSGGAVVVLIAGFLLWDSSHPEVSYNADVRPIFNERCLACHGGVKAEADFSLLFREEALDTTRSGRYAIVPGRPDESELIRRVSHSDPNERMPPEGAPLTEEEIETLEAWIDQGAAWERHWAYLPPDEPPLPEVSDPEWPENGIDHFVRAQLDEEGLEPTPEAECRPLIRRVSLDLVGLPPTPEEAEAFCRDDAPDAYERLVDRLLAAPGFGERWAAMWLDLARYADTKGYEKDPHRTIWRYRDWVIRAFNDDMPFDRFTVEQLAGDLLPDPNTEQLLATAFHRNTMTNTEGGTRNEEFRVAAVIDRLNTTWEVWQGTTMECVQCHSHPYDPFRHQEFYKLYAFFNNTEDADRDDDRPRLPVFEEDDRVQGERLRAEIATLQSRIDSLLRTPAMEEKRRQWEETVRRALASSNDDVTLAPEEFPAPGDEKTRVLTVINRPEEERALSEQDHVIEVFGRMAPEAAPLRETLAAKKEALAALNPVYTAILKELPSDHSRTTRVFERGNWRVHGEEVQRDIPGSMNGFAEAVPKNRLGLARWLVSEDNPLTARVTVNRFWAQLFGTGLVETLGDFGTQGAQPSHPHLLDWMAVRLATDHAWSVKALLKEIVMSATYRQSSRATPVLRERDPRNRLLARGPRVRLSAEQVRDQALSVSGLLSDKMYGPSVMPYQPEGVWNTVYSNEKWELSDGEDRYRRAVYTYWKRTSPYPAMTTFDAPSRETVVSRRVRTNTPLQALVTMNDPAYVEAARALAEYMVEQDGTVDTQLAAGYERALLEAPDAATRSELHRLYDEALDVYREHPEKAEQLTAVGVREAADAETAALTVVANAVMNTDAFIMKQ